MYQPTFETVSGKMTKYPKCSADMANCVVGGATLVYKPRREYCELAFIKTIPFTPVIGTLSQNKLLQEIQFSAEQMAGKLEEEETSTEKTPMVFASENTNDAVRFLRKSKVFRCGQMVYGTNYKGLYLSKKRVENAQQINVKDIRIIHHHNEQIADLKQQLVLKHRVLRGGNVTDTDEER